MKELFKIAMYMHDLCLGSVLFTAGSYQESFWVLWEASPMRHALIICMIFSACNVVIIYVRNVVTVVCSSRDWCGGKNLDRSRAGR